MESMLEMKEKIDRIWNSSEIEGYLQNILLVLPTEKWTEIKSEICDEGGFEGIFI